MATTVATGKAIIQAIVGGVPTNIAVWAAIFTPSQSVEQQWNEEVLQDNGGADGAWMARNLHKIRDISIKPTAASLASAKLATVFLAPFAKITFSGSDSTEFDGDWQYMNGAKIDLKNTESAAMTVKCRQYSDATQNTASTTAVT